MIKRSGRPSPRKKKKRTVREFRIQGGGYMAGDLPIEKAGPPPKGPMAGFHKAAEPDGGAGGPESPAASANPSDE